MLARILNNDKRNEHGGPQLLFLRKKSTSTPSSTIFEDAPVFTSSVDGKVDEHFTFQVDSCAAESSAEQGAGALVGARRWEETRGEMEREVQMPKSEDGDEAQAEDQFLIPDGACNYRSCIPTPPFAPTCRANARDRRGCCDRA